MTSLTSAQNPESQADVTVIKTQVVLALRGQEFSNGPASPVPRLLNNALFSFLPDVARTNRRRRQESTKGDKRKRGV